MSHGVYLVTGRREYRGHRTGETFTAKLDAHAERRAINRGDIQLLERLVPAIEPDQLTLPAGWLAGPTRPDQPRRRKAPHS